MTTVGRAPEPRRLESADGVVLEAELAPGHGEPHVGAVLCHPHPQYGGSMRSIVIGALFAQLPATGVSCLRFNFRGVEGSTGAWDEGRGEREDALAAVRMLRSELPPECPLVLVGWSFGADVALSVRDPAVSGWLAIAPPLRYAHDVPSLASDSRPKQFVLAEHDEFRAPADMAAILGGWRETEVAVVPGASHFFVGRTDRVVALARSFCDRVAALRS